MNSTVRFSLINYKEKGENPKVVDNRTTNDPKSQTSINGR